MKRRFLILSVFALAAFVLVPISALADSATHTYVLEMESPNVSQAPNGDRVAVTGEGEFSVHPKSVEAEGEFTHTNSQGTVIASGDWEAIQLLAYQSYGCGILVNVPGGPIDIPDNLCGGMLKLRVHLTVTAPREIAGFQTEGILTVFCIIGPNPPNSHDDPSEEGITLVVPGVLNFNKIVSGENVYIQTS